tara:strand:- start:100 stop:669 length:570 start_codon:yes stop_codon:yes gene_type:complete
MFKLDVELLNDKKFIAMLQSLSNEKTNVAIKAGVKDAGRAARMVISKGLRNPGNLNLASSIIKEDVYEPRYTPGGTGLTVKAAYTPRTARAYKAKANARGLGVTFYKGQRHQIKRGFFVKGSGSKAGLPFARTSDERNAKLRIISGPSIAAAYTNGQNSDALKAKVERVMEEKLVAGIKRRLKSFTRGF